MQKSQTGTIDLPEDEPAVVKLLMQYLHECEHEPIRLAVSQKAALATPVATPVKRVGEAATRHPKWEGNLVFSHTCDRLGYGPYSACVVTDVCEHHRCGNDCYYSCNNFSCLSALRSLWLTFLLPSVDLISSSSTRNCTRSATSTEVVRLKYLGQQKFSRACQHFWSISDFPVAAHHSFSITPEADKGLRDLVSNTISHHIRLVEESVVRELLSQYNGSVQASWMRGSRSTDGARRVGHLIASVASMPPFGKFGSSAPEWDLMGCDMVKWRFDSKKDSRNQG